jgi:hypothetical protein
MFVHGCMSPDSPLKGGARPQRRDPLGLRGGVTTLCPVASRRNVPAVNPDVPFCPGLVQVPPRLALDPPVQPGLHKTLPGQPVLRAAPEGWPRPNRSFPHTGDVPSALSYGATTRVACQTTRLPTVVGSPRSPSGCARSAFPTTLKGGAPCGPFLWRPALQRGREASPRERERTSTCLAPALKHAGQNRPLEGAMDAPTRAAV